MADDGADSALQAAVASALTNIGAPLHEDQDAVAQWLTAKGLDQLAASANDALRRQVAAPS